MRNSPYQLMRLALLGGLVLLSGCLPMVQVTNLREPACAAEIQQAFDSIFAEWGEAPPLITPALAPKKISDQGFLGESYSGAEDYTFYFARNGSRCFLRLEKFSNLSRKNNYEVTQQGLQHATFMGQRELSSCACSE